MYSSDFASILCKTEANERMKSVEVNIRKISNFSYFLIISFATCPIVSSDNLSNKDTSFNLMIDYLRNFANKNIGISLIQQKKELH